MQPNHLDVGLCTHLFMDVEEPGLAAPCGIEWFSPIQPLAVFGTTTQRRSR